MTWMFNQVCSGNLGLVQSFCCTVAWRQFACWWWLILQGRWRSPLSLSICMSPPVPHLILNGTVLEKIHTLLVSLTLVTKWEMHGVYALLLKFILSHLPPPIQFLFNMILNCIPYHTLYPIFFLHGTDVEVSLLISRQNTCTEAKTVHLWLVSACPFVPRKLDSIAWYSFHWHESSLEYVVECFQECIEMITICNFTWQWLSDSTVWNS